MTKVPFSHGFHAKRQANLLETRALQTGLCKLGINHSEFALHSPWVQTNLTSRQGVWKPWGLKRRAPAFRKQPLKHRRAWLKHGLYNWQRRKRARPLVPQSKRSSVWPQRSGRDISPSV